MDLTPEEHGRVERREATLRAGRADKTSELKKSTEIIADGASKGKQEMAAESANFRQATRRSSAA